MKQTKLAKRILSLLLCFGLLVSCISGAISVFAASITEYTTSNFGNEVAAVKAEITGSDNLLLGSSLNKVASISSLQAGQYTVTGSAKDSTGTTVFTAATSGNPIHLADGNLPWASGQAELYVHPGSAYSQYAEPVNGRLVFTTADSESFRNDVWYDITFRLKAFSDIDKIIVVNSTGLNWQTLGAYDLYVADNFNELYTDASLVYSVDNNNKTTIQSITCDDNVKGSFIGIRITQGVNDNFLGSGYEAGFAFPRVFEVAAIGTPVYTVATSNPTKSDDTMIADKASSGQSITENILYGATPSKTEISKQGKIVNEIHSSRLPNMTDGYYNNTATTSCDITYDIFAHQDGSEWIFHNGWDIASKTWNYDNVDSYAKFTYDLSGNYSLTDFWIYQENSSSLALTLGAYEIYASNSDTELYDSSNMIARYANVYLSPCQKFHFEKPISAKYFGIKVIMGTQGTNYQQYNRARLLEVALFGTNNDPYNVVLSSPTFSNASMITDTTPNGKTIDQNLLFGNSPVVTGKQNGKSATVNTNNLHRLNDGYYYSTSSASCDVSGVKFSVEPYSYNDNGGITGGTYVNGWNPVARTYNMDAVDTYATFTYSLGKIYDISDFWMFNEANAKLQTAVYEVYVGNERATLYHQDNKAFTYVNTDDSGWAQKVHFNKKPQGKYLGVKIIMGVTQTTWETPYSYMRLIEIAAFGEEATEIADARTFIDTVDFSNIEIADAFWSGRQDQTLLVSFGHAAEQFEKVGAIRNFESAGRLYADALATLGEDATEAEVLALVKTKQNDTATYPKYGGNFASDSDVYKVMEGMAYAIKNYDDSEDAEIQAGVAKLRAYLDEWTKLIVAAQGRDGYLNTIYTIYQDPFSWVADLTPTGRFQNRAMHELYCLGHLYEAAVAIYNATGDRRLLDASMKSLDMLYSVFYLKNHETYKATFNAPGHEEIELALVKLAATVYEMDDYGPEYAEKCITLAQYYLDTNNKEQGSKINGNTAVYLPVGELTEAWGHCVRAFYLYTGMAELSIAKGELLYTNLETLWENVETKTYVTGGIGHRSYTEGLPESYELPNDEDLAYCETCASISNVFWNKSMFKIFGDAKYFDNIEKQLYNNVLSGVGLDGISFNYTNNLETLDGYLRTEWKGTPCCPTNLVRLINKLGEYIYAVDETANTAYVNLYIGSKGSFNLSDTEIGVNMTSSMPWEGEAKLTLSLEEAKEFTLKLRLPGWAKGANAITVNGESYTATAGEDGYVSITRAWNNGDVIEINFPMEVQLVRNGDVIPANKGLVAVTRGPITYCAEQQDSALELDLICVNEESVFSTEFVTDFVSDNTYKTAELQILNVTAQNIIDYQSGKATTVSFKMIPYLAWSNRGADGMKVYLRDGSVIYDTWNDSKTIAQNATSSATASHSGSPVSKLNDNDRTYGSRWSSWLSSAYPQESKTPTISYDFGNNYVKLTATDIYFYTDGGGCQLPESVDIEYWNGEEWLDVTLTNTPELTFASKYSSGNNKIYLGVYQFKEIITNQIRVNLSHSTRAHGISEWELTGERIKAVASLSISAKTTDGADVSAKALEISDGFVAAGESTLRAADIISYNSLEYEFKYWMVNGEKHEGNPLSISFTEGEAHEITAFYSQKIEEPKFTITFIEKNGQTIGSISSASSIKESDLLSNGIAAAPIFGYEFIGWSEDITSLNSDATVYPVYNKVSDDSINCVITITNGAINGETSFNTRFDTKLTAIAEKVEGKEFSHWENGTGDVISAKESYTFFAPSSISLKAVYKEIGTESADLSEIIINENPLYSKANGKYNVAFTSTVSLPDNAEIKALGVIIGGTNYNDAPETLTLDSYNLIGTAKNTERANFMITLTGVNIGKTRNARAFVTYELDGVSYTGYSKSVIRIVTAEDGITSSSHSAN